MIESFNNLKCYSFDRELILIEADLNDFSNSINSIFQTTISLQNKDVKQSNCNLKSRVIKTKSDPFLSSSREGLSNMVMNGSYSPPLIQERKPVLLEMLTSDQSSKNYTEQRNLLTLLRHQKHISMKHNCASSLIQQRTSLLRKILTSDQSSKNHTNQRDLPILRRQKHISMEHSYARPLIEQYTTLRKMLTSNHESKCYTNQRDLSILRRQKHRFMEHSYARPSNRTIHHVA